MTENLEKIRPALVALEVGDSVTFHISRLKSVRTQASELGAIHNLRLSNLHLTFNKLLT